MKNATKATGQLLEFGLNLGWDDGMFGLTEGYHFRAYVLRDENETDEAIGTQLMLLIEDFFFSALDTANAPSSTYLEFTHLYAGKLYVDDRRTIIVHFKESRKYGSRFSRVLKSFETLNKQNRFLTAKRIARLEQLKQTKQCA